MSLGTRRGLWLGLAGPALGATAAGVWAAATGDHDGSAALNAALFTVVSWSFVGGGLIASLRRPDNRTGRLLATVGFFFLLGLLQESDSSLLHTFGRAVSALALAAFIQLLLAYPSGNLHSRAERMIVAGAYATAVVANATTLLFDARSDCAKCPANALLVSDQPTLTTVLSALFDAVGALIAASIVVLLVRRFHSESAAARRRLAWILGAGALALVLLGIGFAVNPASMRVSTVIFDIGLLVFATVPFLFLMGLMRTRLARGGVAELLVEVRESAALEDAEAGLRRVLRDPELRLAAWSPERGRFVDTAGNEIVDTDDERRVTTVVRAEGGEAVAALVHDRALLEERELLQGAVAAARLALQRSRLQHELRVRLEELQRERDFVAKVVNSAPAFHVVLDLAGRVIRFNDPLADASGIVDDERVRGRHFCELFAVPEDAEAVGAAILAGDGLEHEHRWRAADGSELVIAWKVQRLEDGLGRPRLLLSGIDVTERKRQEDELRRSRARLVEAGDHERQRLERNLHDGAQQRLVSLSLALRLAQAKLRSDPDGSDEILSAASAELALALQELRELARGLHPAVLADRGLGPALGSLVERSPVPVELELAVDERLPEGVEVAAFYVVSESLTNVAKYAHATAAHVRLERTPDGLELEVADDGIGGADPARGTGLRGLVDRVDALGGTLEVDSPPGGGTRVRASLPVRAAVPQDAG